MALHLHMINLDCADVAGQAAFWAGALGLTVDDHDGNAFMRTIGGSSPAGPRMMFLAVPEGKTVKNRLHLDIEVEDIEAAAAEAERLGAKRVGRVVADVEGSYLVMSDPEGNEFCFVHD